MEKMIEELENAMEREREAAEELHPTGVYIGLEYAHKIVSQYASQYKELNAELLSACKKVVKGYEDDGMEQMETRDKVFYKVCKEAITKAEQS